MTEEKKLFVDWLNANYDFSSKKLVTDCASRVWKLEAAFKASFGNSFSFEDEYEKDKGASVMALFARAGHNDEAAKLKEGTLPIGSKQMYPLKSALKKYFEYLASQDQ